jgi:hypothetical protein
LRTVPYGSVTIIIQLDRQAGFAKRYRFRKRGYDCNQNGEVLMFQSTGRLACLVAFGLISSALPAVAVAAENRCGWIENPTPRNWWLEDRDNTWTIMTQGSDEGAEGMDLIPDISERDYVATNGNYGYACACLKVETDGKETITKILSFKQLKLAQCRNDKSLKFKG